MKLRHLTLALFLLLDIAYSMAQLSPVKRNTNIALGITEEKKTVPLLVS